MTAAIPILLLVFTLTPASRANDSNTVLADVDSVILLIEEGHIADSLETLTNLESSPELQGDDVQSLVRWAKGMAYFYGRDYERATETLNAALPLLEEAAGADTEQTFRYLEALSDAYHSLGIMFLERGELLEAAEYHRKGLLLPVATNLWRGHAYRRSKCLLEAEKYTEAIPSAKLALAFYVGSFYRGKPVHFTRSLDCLATCFVETGRERAEPFAAFAGPGVASGTDFFAQGPSFGLSGEDEAALRHRVGLLLDGTPSMVRLSSREYGNGTVGSARYPSARICHVLAFAYVMLGEPEKSLEMMKRALAATPVGDPVFTELARDLACFEFYDSGDVFHALEALDDTRGRLILTEGLARLAGENPRAL